MTFAHCTTFKMLYYLRVHVHDDRKQRTLKFHFFVTRDMLSIFLVIQLASGCPFLLLLFDFLKCLLNSIRKNYNHLMAKFYFACYNSIGLFKRYLITLNYNSMCHYSTIIFISSFKYMLHLPQCQSIIHIIYFYSIFL